MRQIAESIVRVACVVLAIAPRTDAATRPMPEISRVLIVSVDGLRPDLVLRAKAPVLRGLLDRGTYTLWATTTPSSVTLPSHTSMLTGVPPSVHGIDWNETLPFVPNESVRSDAAVADTAVALIKRHAPEVLFVHFPDVDAAGHRSGWGSPEQITTIAATDKQLRRLLEALRRRTLLDSTVVLVSSDHGGAGKTHGPDDARSRRIPWIVKGPGIRVDYDLTRNDALNVRTEDTFATVCWLLGIDVPEPVEGRPIREIAADPALRSAGEDAR